jgi:cytochrome c biogenesis protein ResB
MLAQPVDAPARMQRFPGYAKVTSTTSAMAVLDRAEAHLRKGGYRVVRRAGSVSAERGYIRETGNLIFHFSLMGVLVAAGFGGGFSYNGQRVLVEGEVFVNNLASYDSFSPGVFFDENNLQPFSRLGRNVWLWAGNHVGHHSTIGDHCFLASHVVVSGSVDVGESSFIGVNATIRDNVRIGARNVIGAGVVILADTRDAEVYIGPKTEASRVPSHRLRGI